jgi:hypothetical protein
MLTTNYINKLIELGKIEKVGSGPKTAYQIKEESVDYRQS